MTDKDHDQDEPQFELAPCDKCGVAAGVVEVAGHLQCKNCGHIVEDCCGD